MIKDLHLFKAQKLLHKVKCHLKNPEFVRASILRISQIYAGHRFYNLLKKEPLVKKLKKVRVSKYERQTQSLPKNSKPDFDTNMRPLPSSQVISFSSINHRISKRNQLREKRLASSYKPLPQAPLYHFKLQRPEGPFQFIFNSRDQWVRRTLVKWGWQEIKVFSSTLYNLKWVFTDAKEEYDQRQHQFINHFPRNYQLTTKNALKRNLASHISQFGLPSQFFFPKSFEPALPLQKLEIQFEQSRLEVSILLRGANRILKERCQYYEQAWEQIIDKKSVQQYQGNQLAINSFFKLCKLIRKCIALFDPSFKQKYQKLFPQSLPLLSLLSTQTLTRPLVSKLLKEYFKMSSLVGPLWEAQGDKKIWIEKPFGNARGNGIKLFQDLKVLRQAQNSLRIVQKYIQNPLILQNCSRKQFNFRKFDIRQWVLVTSLSPLKIYMFSECYLRFSRDKFTLDSIQNLFAHLTNYSLNKDSSHNYMLLTQFRKQLYKQKKKLWETDILPQIQTIIFQTVASCAKQMVHSSHSFQLYGFDILLDQKLNPWLLEVNLSPACQERGKDLSAVLQAMSQQLLKMVLPFGCGEKQQSEFYWRQVSGGEREEGGLAVVGLK